MAEQEITKLSLERYSPEAKALIVETQALADASQHAEVTPLHLLSQCLSSDPAIAEVFRRATRNLPQLQAAVEQALTRQPVARERACLSTLLLDLMNRAEREAQGAADGRVGVDHLLNALAQEVRGSAGEILGAFQLGPGSLRAHLGVLRAAPRPLPKPAADGGHPITESYTTALWEKGQTGSQGVMIGRGAELRRLLTILERRHKHHPLLVGETGVGKATMLRGLAERVARGDVPNSLRSLHLRQLDVGSLVAGTRLRGELEGRARKLLDALAATEGGALVILGFDQVYAAGSPLAGLSDLLRSAITRQKLRLICTTTPEGERRIAEKDPLLLEELTRLLVQEPSLSEAADMVRGAATTYERHHRVQIGEGAVLAAVSLAKRYVSDRFLPDSALDLLDEAAAARRVQADGSPPELDEPLRRLESVEVQMAALEGVEDEVTRRALERLRREAGELRPTVEALIERSNSRSTAQALVQSRRSALAAAEAEGAAARAAGELARAGALEHEQLPELRRQLQSAELAAAKVGAESGPPTLSGEDVARTLADWTGVPVSKMLEEEAEKLSKMEERLRRRVVGQDIALTKVSRAVRRSRVGLRDPRRPIGSFLFLGPSGVGKTELAKALAQYLFDDERALTRLDMSEYMERHMAQRLLGAPPGYADSDRGGLLTEAVRQRPYSVLLFDEVEKAHQDVFNLLLQVLDDGRLTDGRGRLTDFTNTVVILTSNIGASRVTETSTERLETEEGVEELRGRLQKELSDFFRPEFLNRVGETIIFRPLSRRHLRAIVDIQIERLAELLSGRGLSIDVSAEAKQQLVEWSYEPALGARPLERTLVRRLQDPIAEGLLSGHFRSGQRIVVDWVDPELSLRAEPAASEG